MDSKDLADQLMLGFAREDRQGVLYDDCYTHIRSGKKNRSEGVPLPLLRQRPRGHHKEEGEEVLPNLALRTARPQGRHDEDHLRACQRQAQRKQAAPPKSPIST